MREKERTERGRDRREREREESREREWREKEINHKINGMLLWSASCFRIFSS